MSEKNVRRGQGCPHAVKCGGCQLQNMTYDEQLAFKQAKVKKLLGKFCPVRPIWGMENPYHYRSKVQAAFGLDARRKIISGVYQSSSHRIVPVDSCMIEDKTADAIITDIRRLLPKFRLTAYDERSGTGLLRHVLVRRGFVTGEVLVVLVTSQVIIPGAKLFVKELLRLHPEITTVLQNVNARFTPLVLGEKEKVLYGKGYIEDKICSLTFRISAKSFYQVNPLQAERLFQEAVRMAELSGTERVLDAYCGVGTIGLIAAEKAGQVVGVELNRDAVQDAITNARRNGIKNCWFTQGDAGKFMQELAAEKEPADVVFMDPPRAGSDEAFLSALCEMAPSRVVYISCNPETQARDLEYLTSHGYKALCAQPVDMFPHTSHTECIVSLRRTTHSSI